MHALATRFNVRFPASAMPTAPLVNPEYMQERWKIFTEYTLPSVLRQTIKPDTWVLYFDEERSESIRAEIDDVGRINPFISVRFVESSEQVVPDLRQLVAASSDDFVITSRLDNDDILHPEFIADVQRAALLQEAEKCVIDFPNYYGFRLNQLTVHKRMMRITTPFSSLVEDRENVITVLSTEHQKLDTTIGLVRKLPQCRTMAVWHESNILNGKKSRTLKSMLRRMLGHKENEALLASEAAQILSNYGFDDIALRVKSI